MRHLEECPCSFIPFVVKVPPGGGTQVETAQIRRMYQERKYSGNVHGTEKVFDLYNVSCNDMMNKHAKSTVPNEDYPSSAQDPPIQCFEEVVYDV